MPNNIIDKSLLITEPLLNDESISEKKYDVYYPVIGSNLNTNSQTSFIIEYHKKTRKRDRYSFHQLLYLF